MVRSEVMVTGDMATQGVLAISSHDIVVVLPEYSSFGTSKDLTIVWYRD